MITPHPPFSLLPTLRSRFQWLDAPLFFLLLLTATVGRSQSSQGPAEHPISSLFIEKSVPPSVPATPDIDKSAAVLPLSTEYMTTPTLMQVDQDTSASEIVGIENILTSVSLRGTPQSDSVEATRADEEVDVLPLITSEKPSAADGSTSVALHSLVKINLNQATVADLTTLPGVDPYRADLIIAHRRSIGGFRRIEQLREVFGISESHYLRLSPLVDVGPVPFLGQSGKSESSISLPLQLPALPE